MSPAPAPPCGAGEEQHVAVGREVGVAVIERRVHRRTQVHGRLPGALGPRAPRDPDVEPPEPTRHSSALAIAYAGLGRRSDAIALAGVVMTPDPVAFDAIDGPAVLENLALAYLLAGEQASALDMLERVLSIPSLPSPQLLRLDPLWDPLRGNPRFERPARGGR